MNELNGTLSQKYNHLKDILAGMGESIIAMSGGVDSVFLAKVASEILGDRALVVTANSPSLPRRELRQAIELAQQFGFRHQIISTSEISDLRYAANPTNRCYFCKDHLFIHLERLGREQQIRWICIGENEDDLSDFRPGAQAAQEHTIRAPLKEAGLGKEEIRTLARAVGLPIWDKPASACLASRIPYGVQVTPQVLAQVEAAEDLLWELGFQQIRVRHHGEIARLEVAPQQMHALVDLAPALHQKLHELGYKYITMDLAGYRRGSLNEGLLPLDQVK